MFHSSRSGQALLESIIAGSILTIGFLGLLALLARSISVNRVVADNYVGTYLAVEGIEVVKNVIDANILHGSAWSDGLANQDYEVEYNTCSSGHFPCAFPIYNDDHFLAFDPDTNLYSYHGSRETTYKRKVSVHVEDDEITVNSRVSWISRGGGTFQINLEDHFLNWRPRPS